jgi:hypothetical protein
VSLDSVDLYGYHILDVPNDEGGRDCLRWQRVNGIPRERRYVRVAGVAPDIDVVPFVDCIDTLLRGVLERVFLVKDGPGFSRPPRPKAGVFSRRLAAVWNELAPLLPSTAPVSHGRFVQDCRGCKRKRYQRALDEKRAGRFNLEEDARLAVFVKFEKTDRTTKSDPVPRIISPRGYRYNLSVGRYLKPLEKKIFRSIDRMFGHKTVLKGLNAVNSATVLREKWEHFRDPVAIGLDASRFDQHVSREALLWEHGVYKACFRETKHKERLGVLLDAQLLNHCVGETPDGRVEYSVSGTRMSGDMNTSLGNCLLMCAMVRAYARARGVEVCLANNGDDCVVFMERQEEGVFSSGLREWFLEMGFNMAIEPTVDEFEQVEFCQTKPVWTPDGWIMCRNISTAVVKDSIMLHRWDGSSLFMGWLDAVGTGGLSLTGGLPVYQELYRSYVRSGRKRPLSEDLLPWSFRDWKRGVNRVYGAVHPHTRASFWLAFDVTPDEQLLLEDYYRKLVIRSDVVPYEARYVFSLVSTPG